MKTSCGIACLKFENNKYHVLLIRKRSTYAFINFVNGKYTYKCKLSELLNKMTVEEKQIILSFNYDFIFYQAFGMMPNDLFLSRFQIGKSKFNNLDKNKLKDLINKSACIQPIWDFPKGKHEPGEGNFECAIREFEEETNCKDYDIIGAEPYQHEFNDCNVKYRYIIYTAFARKFDLKFKSCNEIIECRWFTIEQARFLVRPHIVHVITNIIRNYKKNRKQYKK